MASLALCVAAAIAEIAGCFTFWMWVRKGSSALWLVPGIICLVAFAWILTKIESDFAGRAYAAYGGVYIAASIVWLWLFEGRVPERADLAGAGLAMAGAAISLASPR